MQGQLLGRLDGSEAFSFGEEMGLFGLGGIELAVVDELELIVHQ